MMNNNNNIFLPLFIILLLSCFAAASIFTVPSPQYPTIADAAFVAVNDGDEIQVVDDVNGCGNNADGAVLRASVMIVGKQGMMPTVDCLGRGRAITAVNISSVKIENIRFVNGYSASSGGAVYVGGKIDRVEIRGCEFLNNGADGTTDEYYDYDDNYYHSSSVDGGGGLAIFGRSSVQIIVANNDFVENTAPVGIGGGATYIFLSAVSNVTLDDRSNRYIGGSAACGGGVAAYFGNITASSALNIGNEGALFANNTSSQHRGGGGGVYALFTQGVSDSTLNIGNDNSLFQSNSVFNSGGAIWTNLGSAVNVAATISSHNSSFISNSFAQIYVASVSMMSAEISIMGGKFSTTVPAEYKRNILVSDSASKLTFSGSANFNFLSGSPGFFGSGVLAKSNVKDPRNGLHFFINPAAVSHIFVYLQSLSLQDSSVIVEGEFRPSDSETRNLTPILYTLLCLFSCCLILIRVFLPRCDCLLSEMNRNYERIRFVIMCCGLIFSFILAYIRTNRPSSDNSVFVFFIAPFLFIISIFLSTSLFFIVKPQHKFFITDESMRLTMLVLCSLLLLMVVESQAVDGLWMIPSMLAVILVTWPPLGIRTSLWHRLQSDIKRDVLTIRKERLLVISGVLGQMIVIICWMMPFAWAASSENGHILRTLTNVGWMPTFPLQFLLFLLATVHVYANNELYPVLQKRHQDRINNNQRMSIATIDADESTHTINIVKKSQLIAGVAAFSPLLGVASIAVCVAVAWIPMTSNEQSAVIAMGVIGVIRCVLQQIALVKKRGRRHRDIGTNELSLSSFTQSMREMWRQSSSLHLKQRIKDMLKPIATFFGSWIGTQWMVIVNGLVTSIPLMVVLTAHQISQDNSQNGDYDDNDETVQQMTGLLIGLGAASAIVAATSLIGDAYPRYKILPVDESFRLTSILKSLMLAVKGLVLSTTASSSCGGRYEILGKILLVQYFFTFAFSFFLTFVNVQSLETMLPKMSLPNGRMFLFGYCWSFVITKIAAILLPLAENLGTFFLSYQQVCADGTHKKMSTDKLKFVFSTLAIGLFFSITMNNETAHFLDTCKKIFNSETTLEKFPNEGIAAMSILIPVAWLGISATFVSLFFLGFAQEVIDGCYFFAFQCPMYLLCMLILTVMVVSFILLEIGLMHAPFWSRLFKSKAVGELSTDVEMTSIQRDTPSINATSI